MCADNTNSIFGGTERNGENNVSTKLQQNTGHCFIGVECAGHIFHNAVRAATDMFPVDVEKIVSEIRLDFRLETL